MTTDRLTRAEAAERSRLVHGVAYEVHLDLSVEWTEFPSTTVVRFSCAEPGAETFLDLDAAAVDRVVLNGRELGTAAFDAATARVRLHGLEAVNEVRIEARCRYSHTGVGLHRFTDPVDKRVYLHTQFEPFDAHRVYACFDQPDLKATFTLAVDAPAEWVVVSNGPVRERPAGGSPGTWRFAPTPVLSPYITAVVAGPYHEERSQHRDLDFGVYCRQSLAAHLDTAEIVTVTAAGFDFFERAFDYPYPFGADPDAPGSPRIYNQLFVPEFNSGAMENAACVTFSEHYIFRSKVTDALREQRAETILHELAHMWFGDLVTMRWWDDLWLNESFATYMSYLAAVEATRFTNAWASFTTGRKAWAYGQDQLPSTHPVVADMVDTDAVRVNFDGITYAKGASVLRQLVAWVGDDAFMEGLRRYFRRHEWRNATLRDFLQALEETSGRELDSWSKEWLETTGVVTLRPAVATADGRYERLTIVQEAAAEHPTLRAHRVRVGLYDLDGGELRARRSVELDIAGAQTDVAELVGEPVADLLLLNDRDLTFAKVRLDATSLATLQNHLGALHDPVARGLCWYAAWDMTRDAELPTRRFVEFVATHAGMEGDVGVLQTLLRQAQAAADRYGDPANRGAARRRLSAAAREALAGTEPGGDFQLAWVRALVALDDDPTTALGLLDGTAEFAGLAVDTELRWHLVGVLAAHGALTEDHIAAEEDRDPTDLGARRAAAARAARPDPAAKAAAWTLLLNGHDTPLATQRAVAGGFWQPQQDELLHPYISAYVEALESIWSQRSPEEALALTGGLYPSTIVTDEVVAAADRALLLPGVPEPGRRLLAEARDGTLRALRARAADIAAAGSGSAAQISRPPDARG